MVWQTMFGQCIYQSESGIRVYDNGLYRWLLIGSDSLQTLLNKFRPKRPQLHYLRPLLMLARAFPGDCCLLGLGGGGALHALAPRMSGYPLTAVEANAEVISVAQKYFMTTRLKTLQLIHQDAAQFVAGAGKRFKHLLIDLASNDQFPPQCRNEAFFRHCHACLLEDGFLVVNLLSAKEQRELHGIIARVFANQVVTVPVKKSTNLIVIACRSAKRGRLLEVLKRSALVNTLQWDCEWGYLAE